MNADTKILNRKPVSSCFLYTRYTRDANTILAPIMKKKVKP